MEKIKVNMSPNPLDVQTIHASQNDGEARQWEFELHNNGELIDTSDVKEQLVFKTYKGGTEQLLPENGSTPTTSPFLGDIRYPQGLLTDQEFTYRQSPTEEDGLAKITDIKGNTIVWNQLVQNGNFANTANWTVGGTSFTVSNNEATFIGNQYTSFSQPMAKSCIGHKVLAIATCKTDGSNSVFKIRKYTSPTAYTDSNLSITTSYQTLAQLITLDSNLTGITVMFQNNASNSATINVKNVMLFDLTQMGLDISSPSDFTSLFSLPYYDFNQGSLLSFNGNGIKTVGKNLLNARATQTTNGITFTNDNGVITINGTATGNAFFTTTIGLRNGSYFIGAFNDEINSNVHVAVQNKSGAYPLDGTMSSKNRIFSINNDINNFIIWVNGGTTVNNFVLKPMISFESPEYFEPYTSSTLSLPISTYFPTGMKSAGTVYDELTPTKAITRIGAVDLGSLNWTYYSQRSNFYAIISDMAVPSPNSRANAKYPLGNSVTWYEMLENNNDNNTFAITKVSEEKRFYIKNTAYTDVTAFTQAMNGVYLYYELATPTETSFTTASLVTENTEIPLSNNDGVLIGKCTEELSAEPGFHDAKIKLSDSDGECYSNKIQLHVERSPQ